jgi:hypothetical protein
MNKIGAAVGEVALKISAKVIVYATRNIGHQVPAMLGIYS